MHGNENRRLTLTQRLQIQQQRKLLKRCDNVMTGARDDVLNGDMLLEGTATVTKNGVCMERLLTAQDGHCKKTGLLGAPVIIAWRPVSQRGKDPQQQVVTSFN